MNLVQLEDHVATHDVAIREVTTAELLVLKPG